jgi:hypothetical protein
VILLRCLESDAAGIDHSYVLLPLEVAGFATAGIFALQWFTGLSSHGSQGSEKHQTRSTGADQ